MATKLTIKSETHNRDIVDSSKELYTLTSESYVEGSRDNIRWRLEEFCRFLVGEGFSIELINQYINYDGVVYEIDEE